MKDECSSLALQEFVGLRAKMYSILLSNGKPKFTAKGDQKMKMYSTALNRYLSMAKSFEMPWFAPIFGKLFKMGESAVITPPAGVEEKEAEKR